MVFISVHMTNELTTDSEIVTGENDRITFLVTAKGPQEQLSEIPRVDELP